MIGSPTIESDRTLSRWWLALGAVALLWVLAWYLDSFQEGWGTIDLAVYRWGGETASASDDLYDQLFEGFLLFTYTPFAAAAFIPMSWVGWTTLQAIVLLADLIALLVVVAASMRSLGYRLDAGGIGLTMAIAALGARLEPVEETLHFGQVNLVLMAVVVCDLLLPDSSRVKGIGVGLAAGFKLTPAIFIVYLLASRRLAAVVRALAAGAATVVVGFVVLPAESADFWFGRLFMDSERVGGVAYLANQSINAAIVRFSGSTSGESALWLPVAVLLAAFGIWVAVRVRVRGSELAGVLVCALTGLLISPVSWSHHWVWFVPGLVLAVHGARSVILRHGAWRWPVVALCGAAAAFALWAPGWMWRAPAREHRELNWSATESIQGNLYVIVGLALLAWAAWWALRPRVGGPAGDPRGGLADQRSVGSPMNTA